MRDGAFTTSIQFPSVWRRLTRWYTDSVTVPSRVRLSRRGLARLLLGLTRPAPPLLLRRMPLGAVGDAGERHAGSINIGARAL